MKITRKVKMDNGKHLVFLKENDYNFLVKEEYPDDEVVELPGNLLKIKATHCDWFDPMGLSDQEVIAKVNGIK